jgi:hypothetical protein
MLTKKLKLSPNLPTFQIFLALTTKTPKVEKMMTKKNFSLKEAKEMTLTLSRF